MRSIITQVCNGVPHGQTYISSPSTIDNGNSEIFASSLFVHINERGKDVAKPKDTDDKIVIGYTKDGMVFQIVVDGFFGCDRPAVFTFIDNYVIPLMDGYCSNISEHSNASEVTNSLIHTIYSLRSEHAGAAEFTMSLSMTYNKDNELFCAGFGIGDTGIVIKRVDGTIEQLVSHTEVDGFKDAFDGYSSKNINEVIQRNSIFNTKVIPGDELVGYTYVPPSFEIVAKEFETETVHKGQIYKKRVKSLNLDPQNFNNQKSSLFSQLLTVVKAKQEQLVEQVKKTGQLQRFGDDFTVGRLVIPDKLLMSQLQVHALLVSVNDGLTSYIESENKNRGFLGIMGFFNDANKNIGQVTYYKNLITKFQNDHFLSLIILSTLLSNKSPMSQYLVPYLGFQSGSSLEIKLKELLSNELENSNTKERIGSRLAIDIIEELSAKFIRAVNDSRYRAIFEDESIIKQEIAVRT
jgi:hypothetical protein